MWVEHTFEVQQTAQALLIATRDAESSVRSFLLSSDNADTRAVRHRSGRVPASNSTALRTLTADNRVQQDRVQELAPSDHVQERAAEHMRHAGKTRAARCRARRHQFCRRIAQLLDDDPNRDRGRFFHTEQRSVCKDVRRGPLQLRYVLAALIGVALLVGHHPRRRPGGFHAPCLPRAAGAHGRARQGIEASSGG